MNVILLTFANNRLKPLPYLSEEDKKVYKVLSKKASTEKEWHIQHNSFATLQDITEDILLYQEKLVIFSFSGHAGTNQLFTETEAANGEGIAALLGNCPNLKLVVLNGCSTQGQVEGLLAEGVPCVIATSAPVNDQIASQFAISFYHSLVEKSKTIGQAFQDGLNVAKTFSEKKLTASRGEIGLNNLKDTPIWGVFHPKGQAINLEWKFSPELIDDEPFTPNKLLLTKTWQAIAPFLDIKEETLSELDKIDKIITELPHPVSEYLRKLIAKSRPGEKEEIFYFELSSNRLKYLIYTYATCVELLAFTLLAQIWDELAKGTIANLSPVLKDLLKTFFKTNNRDRKTYSYLALINYMWLELETNKCPPFIEEYVVIGKNFREQSSFYQACTKIEQIRLETIHQEIVPSASAKQYCIDLEKQLAEIISHLGFMVKYKMTSMKDIHFIKYKHQVTPKYKLNFVELRYRPAGMDIISQTLVNFMDNASVILLNQENDSIKYLNLSPFIIDENSFDEKAKIANLCVFQSYENVADAFTFRYIYKPLARPLVLKKTTDYFSIIADQFNSFHKLVFKTDLVQQEPNI